MRHHAERLLSWLYVTTIYGPRCSDFTPGCLCCWHWANHDELFNGGPDAPLYPDRWKEGADQ